MEIDTVLVPVDGNDSSVDAVEYAVEIADRYGASVHVLYLLGEQASEAMEAGAVDADTIADRGETVMDRARSVAAGSGVDLDHSSAFGYSVSQLTRHPGTVIVDAADDVGVEFLVVPREPVTGDQAAVIEKAAEYVISYAEQPVLSV
ncbi:MAG: universal stress protein [Natronomonas sp.]